MKVVSNRAGSTIQTVTGYTAFIPKHLPPEPPIKIDDEMQSLLSSADRRLGRLDGIIQVLPNPDLFLAMYVKKEAILSSQIEGTQASFVDVLNVSEDPERTQNSDIKDVVNYVAAINFGLERLNSLPMSLRLIREIHGVLLRGSRGSDKNPGEFRRSQNWIGPAGCNLNTATFVPPPADEMILCMNDLESFFHDTTYIPALIKIAIIHAQFETIHPFLDGNGRVGRLLITFWLCQQNILTQPLLYLSYFFKQHRNEYYDLLMGVRINGDWESWIKFFLRGVASVADEATESARAIIRLKEHFSQKLYESSQNRAHSQQLLDYLFENPIIMRSDVAKYLGISHPTANSLVDLFCRLGILTDIDPDRSRYKRYYFQDYLAILEKGTD